MHTRIGPDNIIYLEDDWVIVRNFKAFEEEVTARGEIPAIVSFDHDLGEIIMETLPGERGKVYVKYSEKTSEKDGYECAVWLHDLCVNKGKFPVRVFIHSMNPVGVDRIKSVWKNV